jgi:hypothetical protein
VTVLEVQAQQVVSVPRSRALDALRGLAILLMVVDHVALFAGAPVLRETVGRVAMPLFFVLGGHLAVRFAWRRQLSITAVGIVLQVLAPWSGAGPLLLTFVLGAYIVSGVRRWPVVLAVFVGWGLTLGANGVAELDFDGLGYNMSCLLGLMALGALLPRDVLTVLGKLPSRVLSVLALAGRRPLTLYAGHVLLLTVLWT